MRMIATQEKIIEVLKDYIRSGDPVSTISRRHAVSNGSLRGWIRKAGLRPKRSRVNWDSVREEALNGHA